MLGISGEQALLVWDDLTARPCFLILPQIPLNLVVSSTVHLPEEENMKTITNGYLKKIKPSDKPFFIRDTTLKGFGVKVNKSGTVKFIAETWHKGRSYRQTIGEFPMLNSKQARKEAISFLNTVKSGNYQKKYISIDLQALFENYVRGNRLKVNTKKNYTEVIFFYLSDWLNKPVSSITKDMVERRFYQIRDNGKSYDINIQSNLESAGCQQSRSNYHVRYDTANMVVDPKGRNDSKCLKINGRGMLPITINGSDDFNVNDLDIETLSFNGLEIHLKGNGDPFCSISDWNEDGHDDLTCHFDDDLGNWIPGGGFATLTGDLLDGTPFSGTNSICVEPLK